MLAALLFTSEWTTVAGAELRSSQPESSQSNLAERAGSEFDVNAFFHSTILASHCQDQSNGETSVDASKDIGLMQTRAKMFDSGSPVQQLLEAWLSWSRYWRRTYYLLTFATLVLGGMATALADGQAWWTRYKTVAALLATVSGGLSSALVPFNQYKKFDNALAVINTAKLNYLTNADFSLCQLGKAIGFGEAIIHQNN